LGVRLVGLCLSWCWFISLTSKMYVVGLSDDWYAVPVDAVKRFLARWFNVGEEEVSLEC